MEEKTTKNLKNAKTITLNKTDIIRALYGYVCILTVAYAGVMGIFNMHKNINKYLSKPRYNISKNLVNKVTENTKIETEFVGEKMILPITSLADSYENPFGSSEFINTDDIFYENTEDLSRAAILETMYPGEPVDDRIESLLNADGTIIVENDPFGKIDGIYGTSYDLSDSEIIQIARLCTQEQGYNVDGVQAEASLMLNRYEMYGEDYSSLISYIRNSGWWSKANYYMNNGKTTSELIEAVKEVVEGDRYFPKNIDEHDCLSDITSVSNNGVKFNKYDKSQYISGVTKIRNKYSSTYTFYTFPTEDSDPFGAIEASHD